MAPSRHAVLVALLAGVAVVTGAILSEILWTVFFAVTVAYVLVPFAAALRRRGLPRWWASIVTTIVAFLAALILLLPIGIILYSRRLELIAVLDGLPSRLVLRAFGRAYVVEAGDVVSLAGRYLTRVAIDVARAAPVLAAKAVVVGFIVFALLLQGSAVRRTLLAPIPAEYHYAAVAFHERIRGTLFALYVIQAATALATFAVAAAVFWLLGYQYFLTLATLAGLLQFLPVVGPSVVVVGVAAFEVTRGQPTAAAVVLLVGLLVVGVLPDALLRPRLARETARLPSSLYFVGFVGGLLSVGAIGIIAGPLAVALLAEAHALLAAETGASSATDVRT